MSHRLTLTTIATLAILWSTAPGRASVPAFWRTSTQAAFLEGEVENLSISTSGRVMLGPAIDLVHETTAPFLWSLVETADGSLWIGSGNDGRVTRLDSTGATAGTFDAAELEVHALAPAPDGGVFAATSPDGQIYRVAPDGTATPFFDPDGKYIWSLAVDADGNLFAGTGEKGIIYRITPDGTGDVFYDTKTTNVTALTFDREGRLLAGTASPGRVFRIDADAGAFVLLESGYQEVHSLHVVDDGRIYATAVSGGRPPDSSAPARPASSQPQPVATVSTEITITAVGSPGVLSAASQSSSRASSGYSGAVFRIETDGVWDTVWKSTEDAPYDVTFDADGGLLIGTGSSGKIYRVEGEPADVTLLARAEGQQVTRFLRTTAGGHYFTTSNPGKLFRLSTARADEGTYTSTVQDATTIATWGSLRWSASTPEDARLEFVTRSGNTATPDDTWSDWSGPYTDEAGEQIDSPKARYLQWRARFVGGTSSPELLSVVAAYLERNLRPEITTLVVHPAGVVFQQPFNGSDVPIAGLEAGPPGTPGSPPAVGGQPAAQPLGRRVYRKGLRSFGWTASDPNQDQLEYDVLYHAEGATDWTVLRRELTAPIFAWDTSSVPDGTYAVKIVASDSPSNSPGSALSGERVSPPVDVDNAPPTIALGRARRDGDRVVVPFTVRDAQSAVERVEFSLDSNDWHVVYPTDGIPDSRVEAYEVVIANADVTRIIIRATDDMKNVTTDVSVAPPLDDARP